MQRYLIIATVAVLFPHPAGAAHSAKYEARAAFREAVTRYQGFVVPHCAPSDVEAYVTARAERDHLFVESLRRTKLSDDYKNAVADQAKQDANTRFECMQPPPPPPPPPGTTTSRSLPPGEPENSRAKHFAAGDRQFETMIRVRDAALRALDD